MGASGRPEPVFGIELTKEKWVLARPQRSIFRLLRWSESREDGRLPRQANTRFDGTVSADHD